jgi:hypothetical protein
MSHTPSFCTSTTWSFSDLIKSTISGVGGRAPPRSASQPGSKSRSRFSCHGFPSPGDESPHRDPESQQLLDRRQCQLASPTTGPIQPRIDAATRPLEPFLVLCGIQLTGVLPIRTEASFLPAEYLRPVLPFLSMTPSWFPKHGISNQTTAFQ